MYTIDDIKEQFKTKYRNKDFRIIGNDVQQSKTIEIQNAQFECPIDHPWIFREPNYDYAKRELEWYESQSLSVNDIPGQTPKMWDACATKDDKKYINSNYGWMVFSPANYRQFDNCLKMLKNDPHTREACMIYMRPSMQVDYNLDGMHDFCCTYATQVFINDEKETPSLKYIYMMRSQDAIFGLNNDIIWHLYVANKLIDELKKFDNDKYKDMTLEPIVCNVGSLHIYERHFKYLK